MRGFVSVVVVAVAVLGFMGRASAAEYAIDGVHTSAIFKVKHLGASYFYGQFADVEGTLEFDAANPEASAVEVEIPTESVVTFNQMRDNHLKGPDFFKAKEFPVMTFESTSWKKVDDDTYSVTGDFTLLGKTREITVQVDHVGMGKNPRSGAELIGFHTTFTIDRTDFGMNYGVTDGPGGLGKDIDIIFSIEAIKQ